MVVWLSLVQGGDDLFFFYKACSLMMRSNDVKNKS